MIGAGIDKKVRAQVYKRDGYRCALCDDPRRLQVHHIKGRGVGGRDWEMNLITLCPVCHALAHGAQIADVFLRKTDMEQAITEYMADLYACEGLVWNPWNQAVVNWKY